MTEQGERGGVQIKEGRRAILDAAAQLFSEGGYASTSLRDIADLAGMKAGSVYYHFSSKDEIVAEVIEFGVRQVADEVARALERTPEDPVTRLRAAIGGHLRSLLELHTYASANIRIYSELPEGLKARTHAARASYDATWRRLIEDCATEGRLRPGVDPSILRLLLIGAMNGALQWRQPRGRLDADALADAFAEIVLQGACGSNP
jgi:AcrR family transcriptional regulator